MDISEVNDFLLQQATGRTKEEIQQDIYEIKRLGQDIEAAKTELREITASLESHTAAVTKLREQSKHLQDLNATLSKENSAFEKENRFLAGELPVLRAERNAYQEEIADLTAKFASLEARIQEAERLENANEREKQEIRELIQAQQEIQRTNHVHTKKLAEVMEENARQMMLVKLSEKPLHVYLRKIQDILDKKNVKLDILKEVAKLE